MSPTEPGDSLPKAEGRDADGLPIDDRGPGHAGPDRPPTIDDVRNRDGSHGRFALGCTVAVVAVLLAFWLIRGGLLG